MTVNVDAGRVVYFGNGSTTAWAFNFSTPDAQSIQVFTEDTLGNVVFQPVGAYSIVLNPLVGTNPTPTGGVVNYPLVGPPLPNGTKILIQRDLERIQSVSLTNQSIIYPPVIEKEFDYLTMLAQGGVDEFSRAFRVSNTDPVPAFVPPVAVRANHTAFFDANGDLVPGEVPAGGVFISAAMIPVVQAPTLSEARIAMGIRSVERISGITGITPNDNGVFFNAAGNAFYNISIGPSGAYPPDFTCFIVNNDVRGKQLAIDGYPLFLLWPSQFCILTQNGVGGWQFVKSGRWRSTAPIVFNVDFANGSDVVDGLGTLTQAFKTISFAVSVLENECDGNFSIKLSAGTHQVGTGVFCGKPVLGSDGYSITGNVANPGSVIIQATSPANVFTATSNAVLTLSGMELRVANGSCIYASNGAVVIVNNVRFGQATGGYHMTASFNATIFVNGPYTITNMANPTFHMNALNGGQIQYNAGTVTFEGVVNITYFLNASFMSTIIMYATTFINGGFCNGTTYTVSFNSVVASSGSVIPGTLPGVANTGGIFF